MNNIIRFASFMICILALQSCVKDLQDDVNNGGWNHERSVIGIEFENQIGAASIENADATTGHIDLAINVGAQPSMTSVKLKKLDLSFQATSSVKVGDALDFSNGQASFTVTSTLGETRTYTIHVSEFTESLVGTYQVNTLTIFGGTGPEYGGGAIMQLADKPWCWSDTYGPDAECDNTLTFTLTGVTDDGSTTGTCINNAGDDGKYADFMFQGSMNKEEEGVDIDLKKFYRQIPEGESTWIRNYSEGTVTFISKDGRTTVGQFVEAGTIDVGYDKSFTVDNLAFQFSLNGTDDWTNIYSDYDKFAKKPRILWVSVTKVN